MLWLWHFSSNYSIHWNVNKHTKALWEEKWKSRSRLNCFLFFFIWLLERKRSTGGKGRDDGCEFSAPFLRRRTIGTERRLYIYVRECILNLLFVYLFKFLKNKESKHVWSMWPASTFRLVFISYLLCGDDIIQRRAGTVQIVGIVRVLSLIWATEINKKQQGKNHVQRYQMMKRSFECCRYSFCDMIESGESCARQL